MPLRRHLRFAVLDRRPQRDHSLVRTRAGQPIERFARLESQRNAAFPHHSDDLVQARAAGPFRDHYAVERATGAERFTYRMNSGQQAHANNQDNNFEDCARTSATWFTMTSE